MESIKYIVYREGKYYVAICLNIELSTFGETIDEALKNLDEAMNLYFEDKDNVPGPIKIENVMPGEKLINA